MKKDVIIRYLPNTTTQEEIKMIRDEFDKEFKDEDVSLILMISGKDKLLNCLLLCKSLI